MWKAFLAITFVLVLTTCVMTVNFARLQDTLDRQEVEIHNLHSTIDWLRANLIIYQNMNPEATPIPSTVEPVIR